jgi:hypothetical protein
MERDFLLYLVFYAFIEIRVRVVEIDMISFNLCSLHHNIPLALISQNTDEKAYSDFFLKIEDWGKQEWLKLQLMRFAKEYPQYQDEFLVLVDIKNKHYTIFFLLYILHVALNDLKTLSNNNSDKISYGLSNLLANIPLQLIENEDGKKPYNTLIEHLESLGMYPWLDNRKREFYSRYPKWR